MVKLKFYMLLGYKSEDRTNIENFKPTSQSTRDEESKLPIKRSTFKNSNDNLVLKVFHWFYILGILSFRNWEYSLRNN